MQNKEEDANMSKEEIIEKHWFEFGHTSICLESEDWFFNVQQNNIYTQEAINLPKISNDQDNKIGQRME